MEREYVLRVAAPDERLVAVSFRCVISASLAEGEDYNVAASHQSITHTLLLTTMLL